MAYHYKPRTKYHYNTGTRFSNGIIFCIEAILQERAQKELIDITHKDDGKS
jgi:hypothetical protein